MKKNKWRTYELQANIAKALAHPTRLLIIDELSRGERCVCELREVIGDDFSTVSKHLSVLKSVGLICDDKRGLQVYYSLKCACIEDFFNCVEKVIKQTAKEQLKRIR